jgi:hypothetical protein
MRLEVVDGVFSAAACALLHACSAADYDRGGLQPAGRSHHYFSRGAPTNQLELALDSYLGAAADRAPYVEYWTRQRWMHIGAHADIDEWHAASAPDARALYPAHAHVLYLAVGRRVRGPTCVWEGGEASPFDGCMVAVPAVSGRVVRFDGSLQHAVPRPADVWLDANPARECGSPEEFVRSVVLFNTWEREPPHGIGRREGMGGRLAPSSEPVTCAPRAAWRTVVPATPPAVPDAPGVMKLELLGDAARRDGRDDTLELPVHRGLVRSAVGEPSVVTRLQPPTR